MPSKHFYEILDKMREIHDRKSHDYAQDSDPLSNFKQAASVVENFKNPIDQIFAGIIGIKISRLSELLNGKEPKNESIEDTFIDLANYCVLWGAYYKSQEPINLLKKKMDDGITTLEKNAQENNYILRGFRPGGILTEKCSDCKNHVISIQEFVNHAKVIHGAVFDSINSILTYPSGEKVLI